MAVDIFLKIDDVKGESVVKGHEASMEILSWTWGMTQSGSSHTGGGGGSGKVAVKDLSFTKYVDSGTPNLIKFCCNGKHFKEAKLTVRKAGATPVEYLVIKMSQVLVSRVDTGVTDETNDRIKETVSLNFAKFELEYKGQSATGGAGPGAAVKWNIAANTE